MRFSAAFRSAAFPSATLLSAAFLSALVALAACGGDGDADGDPDASSDSGAADAGAPDGPGNRGSATVTGTLAEQTPAPRVAYVVRHPQLAHQVLVLGEDPATFCQFQRGNGLAIAIGFPCQPPNELADVPLLESAQIDCSSITANGWLVVEGFQGEFREYEAQMGFIINDEVNPAVHQGRFTADFGDKGSLAGDFDAIVCPTLRMDAAEAG